MESIKYPLTLVEQLVIEFYFINGKTLKEIGTCLGIGAERVRQIKAKAVRKIAMSTRQPKPIGETKAWRKYDER